MPSKVSLYPDQLSLDLTYADALCATRVALDERSATVSYALTSTSTLPVQAHAASCRTSARRGRPPPPVETLDDTGFALTGEECGGWFVHHGWRVAVPPTATISWPVIPHNPYAKDGAAPVDHGRLVVTLPLGSTPGEHQLRIEVG